MARTFRLTVYQAGNVRVRPLTFSDSVYVEIHTSNVSNLNWLKRSITGYYIDLVEMTDSGISPSQLGFSTSAGFCPCRIVFHGDAENRSYVVQFNCEKLMKDIPVASEKNRDDSGFQVDVADYLEDVSSGLVDVIDSGCSTVIPMIGLLIKTIGLVSTVRDGLFSRKIKRFLLELDKVDESQRIEFELKMERDKNGFYESLLIVIDQCDSVEKAGLIGKIFSASIRGRISPDVCLRLCSSVNRAFVDDIKAIARFNHPRMNDLEAAEGLVAVGLARRIYDIEDLGLDSNRRSFFELNKYGIMILDLVFNS